jgi:23S rRNA pseudouridine1911/1915/1917 synthase
MYQVIDKFPQYSLLRLELETGKTHQIRVHMSFLGHPLLGDRLYGGRTDLILRPALHSETIEFINPITGLKCSVTARLPEDFRRLI